MQSPTQRELTLVAVLLFLLLAITNTSRFQLPSPAEEEALALATSGGVRVSPNVSQTTAVALRPVSPRLEWGSSTVPPTTIVGHAQGWTIFDRLYILNGTMFIVTDEPEKVPELMWIVSTGRDIKNGKKEMAARLPTDKEMRVVSTKEARRLFGRDADRIDGVTWLVNDPPQFITHYYHFCAELFFGFWRAYSSLDPYIPRSGNTSLPLPRRIMFVRADGFHFRDYASMNQWVLRNSFPGMAMEYTEDWEDRSRSARPYVFDRVILADRSAAMLGYNWRRTQRIASGPFAFPGSVHWWSTIRNSIVDMAMARVEPQPKDQYVITYISRQDWGRRMLIQADHERLVDELYKLRDTYGYEVNVVAMDKMSRVEQFRLAGRTTIMMGVHGNGLTNLLWMRPSARSTVMEFFFPGGFAHDYEWTTRAIGMVHVGFWGDVAFTRPNTPQVAYPDGFQGNEIPLDGALVAKVVQERLTLVEELDEA